MLKRGKVLKQDYDIISYKEITGPASHAIHNIKAKYKLLKNIGYLKVYLTSNDKSNFRYKVAKTKGPKGQGYKEGRPPRPIYYEDVREWMLRNGAEEVFGYEADDALGMNQREDTIAVHQDKDINRIIGKHYNWKTQERYIVPEGIGKLWLVEKVDDKGRKSNSLKGYGNMFFFAQMLMGDSVDNIPGIKKMGDVGAYKALNECSSERHMLDIVLQYYEQQYPNNWQDVLYEAADLLYIMGPEKVKGNEYLRSL